MASDEQADFETLLELLREHRGFDFTGYKRGTLTRRFQKRMEALSIATYADYSAYLLREPAEFDLLFNTVLINVTQFFRDSVPWQYISEEIVPQVVGSKRHEEPVRVWSAGCATGEEAYTLAIVFAESLGTDEFLRRVKIYATDVDEDALIKARAASYSAREVEPVAGPLQERYFDQRGSTYQFKKKLRRSLIFGRNDLTSDAPISKVDLLVCRNTLMYFDAKTQARILNRFHFALNEGGFLVLGKAETLTSHGNKFEPVDFQRRVFAKVASERNRVRAPRKVDTAQVYGDGDAERELALMSDAAFDKSPCAQIVITATGNLALANDNARALFKLNPADIGRPVQDLELSYRPAELRTVLDEVRETLRPVRISEVRWNFAGDDRWFAVQIVPLIQRKAFVGFGVSFEDTTAQHNLRQELERSHAELETAYEELQSTNEELETTNEELHSTVEELETTNEELQSTNQELETMNEELHSTNDELGMFNDELQRRGGELDLTNQFLDSVFESLHGGVAVVDRDLRIQVWNKQAQELWGVRAEEVVNLLLPDIDIGLPLKEVEDLVVATLNDGKQSHYATIKATNRRGRTMVCRVTSTPLIAPGNGQTRGAIVLMEQVNDQ
jgi:two-component system, chemotaxis family, CheB/CheR fusion protein